MLPSWPPGRPELPVSSDARRQKDRLPVARGEEERLVERLLAGSPSTPPSQPPCPQSPGAKGFQRYPSTPAADHLCFAETALSGRAWLISTEGPCVVPDA